VRRPAGSGSNAALRSVDRLGEARIDCRGFDELELGANMFGTRLRSLAAAIGISVATGVAAAGCGGSASTTTVTATTPTQAAATTTTAAAPSGGGSASGGSVSGGGSGGGGASNPLAVITPPPGSKKLDSRTAPGVHYARYSSSLAPGQIVKSYHNKLTSAGWTIVQNGGSGGGWGPYGGSNFGVTGKKNEHDYLDVQAGGQRGQQSYFEVCATGDGGKRSSCDALSDQSLHHTHSGGSQGGSKPNSTNSGGS
jgi:hypothetical protein